MLPKYNDTKIFGKKIKTQQTKRCVTGTNTIKLRYTSFMFINYQKTQSLTKNISDNNRVKNCKTNKGGKIL
jgi:hypothetical protein